MSVPAAFPPHHRLTDAWAGMATALVFYAEYLGLGSLLGEALRPGLPDGVALGTLLVMVPVVLCCLLAAASHGASLAGPRAASMMVVTTSLQLIVAWIPALQGRRTELLAVMTAAAGLTLLAGRLAWVQKVIDKAPPWLVQGFMYATALGIVAGGASAGRLLSCLQVNATATWATYLSGVLLGLLWKPLLVRAQQGLAQRERAAWLQRLLTLLQPLGLLAGAALSWVVYEWSRLALPHGAFCGRFGDMALDGAQLGVRLHGVAAGIGQLPAVAFGAALLAGGIVGVVLLLESLTAFTLNRGQPAYTACQPGMLAATSAGSVLGAAVGAVPASFSTSRTMALRALGGSGRWAAAVHGLALLAIAMLAAPWVAQVPRLTAAVALTLVGVQMVGADTLNLWRCGYHPLSQPAQQRAVVLFWLVMGLSLYLDNALAGFLAMALLAVVFRCLEWMRQRRAQVTALP